MKQILNKFKENTFFINTLWILIIGFLIKILGLINKIYITRILGPNGMSLYILGIPTIMLFVNISGFSLNTTLSKIIPEALVTKKYSPKKLLISGFKIALVISLISIFILLLLLYPLLKYFLKENNLFFPILCAIPLLPLTGISDVLKGYLNGIKKMKYSSFANFYEQIARIIFCFILLIILKDLGIIISTSIAILSLSFGELISIIYCLFKIKKHPPINIKNTKKETKKILSFAIPSTLSRLIGSFIFFLEPIAYTNSLLYFGYNQEIIKYEYMIINAYTIPLLTLGSVISYGIASSILPNISEAYSNNNINTVNYYIKKAFAFIFIFSLLISTILYNYSEETMELLYDVKLGAKFVSNAAFAFITYYISIILVSILQAMGKTKELFILSIILNTLKIILIMITSSNKIWGINSLINSTTLISILTFILYLLILLKNIKIKINIKNIFIYLLITILTISLFNLFKHFNINFIISSIISSLMITYFSFSTNLLSISSLKNIKIKNKHKKNFPSHE